MATLLGTWSAKPQVSTTTTAPVAKPLAAEPIESRAEEYRSPGDNTTPAGETIAAIIGTSSFDGKIVWWGDFQIIDGRVTASFAMVFADCIFTSSADLLKLYADENLIISNVEPLRYSEQNIRFYNGSHTAVDPLLLERLGAANTSAWPGFIYAVFEDFDCGAYGNRVPLVRAVLSGSVTTLAVSEETSTLSFGAVSGHFNTGFAVDPLRNRHYQIVRDNVHDEYITTVDIATNIEINRAPIFGIANFWAVDHPVALYGSDYIACTIGSVVGQDIRPALLNVQTGELVAELPEISLLELRTKRAVPLSSGAATKYLVATEKQDGDAVPADTSDFAMIVVDVTNETMEYVIHPYSAPVAGESNPDPVSVEFGPIVGGVATVWWTEPHPTLEGSVRFAYVTASTFTAGYFYEESVAGKAPKGVAYDPSRNVLVVYREDGSFLKLDGTTGALISTTAGAVTDYNINIWNDDPASGAEDYASFQHAHRNGYILATRGDLNGDIYEINLHTLAASLLLDRDSFLFLEAVYFDQFSGVMTQASATQGAIDRVKLGGSTPNSVDLQDIFTQLMEYDDRFDAADLTFTGFPGDETQGLKLVNDTTIDNLEQSIAELFDVKIVPSDGDRKYFYPQRDGSFAVTATLVEADFVERGSQTVEKSFGASEDEFVACTVEYHDVDVDYRKLPQSYARPIGIYDVTRSRKKRTFNSTLSLTASQSMELATKLVFRSVMGNERYSFSLVPGKTHIEPGDILQISFRDFTAYVRVKEAKLNADYTQDIIALQYLQLSAATFTGAPIDEGEEVAETVPTQLIYLDVPLLSYAHDLGGAGLVQYVQMTGFGPGIINAAAYKSTDGETFTSLGLRSGIEPVAGVISAISGTPSDPFVKDETNTLTVVINAGDIDDLETITDDEFEAGVNLAAIGRNGRWVLLWFQTVSSSGGVATLSDLMWGVRGSEVWIDDLTTGDLFVLIDPDHYTRFSNPTTLLDDTVYYKAANIIMPLGGVPTLAYAAAGVAETPYAPTNLDAVVDGSDIDLTWDYRSRVTSGTNPSNHGEASLSFEIDIMDTDSPESVQRTLTATTNSKTYLSADITTDFGGMPAFLRFRVYMMSAVVGRGYMGENTVQLNADGVPIGLLLTLTYA